MICGSLHLAIDRNCVIDLELVKLFIDFGTILSLKRILVPLMAMSLELIGLGLKYAFTELVELYRGRQ